MLRASTLKPWLLAPTYAALLGFAALAAASGPATSASASSDRQPGRILLAGRQDGERRPARKAKRPASVKRGAVPRIPEAANGAFQDMQVDGDRIKVMVEEGTANKVRIRLKADGTWWKQLKLKDTKGDWHKVEQVDRGYVDNTDTFQVNADRLEDTIQLEFWKAKLLGAHTHMATELFRKSDVNGKRVTFIWRAGLEDPKTDDLGQDIRRPFDESFTVDKQTVTIRSVDNPRLKSGQAQLRFETAFGWWTAVKLLDARKRERLVEKADNSYRPDSQTLTLSLDDYDSLIQLELWTAKLLGAHTHMATKRYARERFEGRTVTVSWGGEAPASAATPLDTNLKIDGKTVTIKGAPGGTTGNATVKLTTTVPWWTGIKIVDKTGKAHWITKENGKYSPANAQRALSISSFNSEIVVEFWTAKLLGAHTHMATRKLPRDRFNSQVVTINWPK